MKKRVETQFEENLLYFHVFIYLFASQVKGFEQIKFIRWELRWSGVL